MRTHTKNWIIILRATYCPSQKLVARVSLPVAMQQSDSIPRPSPQESGSRQHGLTALLPTAPHSPGISAKMRRRTSNRQPIDQSRRTSSPLLCVHTARRGPSDRCEFDYSRPTSDDESARCLIIHEGIVNSDDRTDFCQLLSFCAESPHDLTSDERAVLLLLVAGYAQIPRFHDARQPVTKPPGLRGLPDQMLRRQQYMKYGSSIAPPFALPGGRNLVRSWPQEISECEYPSHYTSPSLRPSAWPSPRLAPYLPALGHHPTPP